MNVERILKSDIPLNKENKFLEDNGFVFKKLDQVFGDEDTESVKNGTPVDRILRNENRPVTCTITPGRTFNHKEPYYFSPETPKVGVNFKISENPPELVDPQLYHCLVSRKLPLPDRMRQILIWCIKKTPVNTDYGRDVVEKFNFIRNNIIRDLQDGTLNISWYSRPSPFKPNQHVELKKHPENIAFMKKIAEYGDDISKLKEEFQQWRTFLDSTEKKMNLIHKKDGKNISDFDFNPRKGEITVYRDPIRSSSRTRSNSELRTMINPESINKRSSGLRKYSDMTRFPVDSMLSNRLSDDFLESAVRAIKSISQDYSVLKDLQSDQIEALSNYRVDVTDKKLGRHISELNNKLLDVFKTFSVISVFNNGANKLIERTTSRLLIDYKDAVNFDPAFNSVDLFKLYTSDPDSE